MPWCRIDKVYQVGDLEILPFELNTPIKDLVDVPIEDVNRILSIYKDIKSRPVKKAAILRYINRSLTADLSDDEISTAYEFVSLACYCGLANRDYFNNLGHYCNRDCFILYVQRFKDVNFTSITTKCLEGSTINVWAIDEIAVSIPIHSHAIRAVSLDETLLNALMAYRDASSEWERWQNAISCFNQANTDSDNVRPQTEWVLLCGAFEHLLGAKPKAKDVASKFEEYFVPQESLMATKAKRKSNKWHDKGRSLRYEWMQEFYRIRGDFAHGKLQTGQSQQWNQYEHLTLAKIAFPLLVKSLLGKFGKYTLNNKDKLHINCFEKFSDTKDFLKEPPDWQGSLDSHWGRALDECCSEFIKGDAVRVVVGMRAGNVVPLDTESLGGGDQNTPT